MGALTGGWGLAAEAGVHLGRMEVLLNRGEKDAAQDEFDLAWRLMNNARTALLEEINAEYEADMAFE